MNTLEEAFHTSLRSYCEGKGLILIASDPSKFGQMPGMDLSQSTFFNGVDQVPVAILLANLILALVNVPRGASLHCAFLHEPLVKTMTCRVKVFSETWSCQ